MYQKICDCKYCNGNTPVQDNLSITPYQMMQMAKDGTPISAQNLGLEYDEGFSELEFTPDLEHRRGVDINDMWNARQEFKKNVCDAKAAGKMQPVTDGNE